MPYLDYGRLVADGRHQFGLGDDEHANRRVFFYSDVAPDQRSRLNADEPAHGREFQMLSELGRDGREVYAVSDAYRPGPTREAADSARLRVTTWHMRRQQQGFIRD